MNYKRIINYKDFAQERKNISALAIISFYEEIKKKIKMIDKKLNFNLKKNA